MDGFTLAGGGEGEATISLFFIDKLLLTSYRPLLRTSSDPFIDNNMLAFMKPTYLVIYHPHPFLSIGAVTQPGGQLYNVELLEGGFVSFESSEVLTDAKGRVIGAIGVSGTKTGGGG